VKAVCPVETLQLRSNGEDGDTKALSYLLVAEIASG